VRKLKVQMNFEGINWDDDMVTFCIDNLKNVDRSYSDESLLKVLSHIGKKLRKIPILMISIAELESQLMTHTKIFIQIHLRLMNGKTQRS